MQTLDTQKVGWTFMILGRRRLIDTQLTTFESGKVPTNLQDTRQKVRFLVVEKVDFLTYITWAYVAHTHFYFGENLVNMFFNSSFVKPKAITRPIQGAAHYKAG